MELAFEGHRYWDVRRWRIAVDVLSKPNSGLRYILDYETGKYQLQILDNVDGTGIFLSRCRVQEIILICRKIRDIRINNKSVEDAPGV